jgi:hypothetical protein
VILGVGLLNKYGIGLYAAAIAAGVLATSTRRVLRCPGPWLGMLVALLLFLPHLLWQLGHGFPTLEFIENAQTLKNLPTSPADFLVAQVLFLHPASAPLWIAGLAFLGLGAAMRPYRWLAIAYLVLAALLLALRVKPYYLAPAYPPLFAAGAALFSRWFAERRRLAVSLVALHAAVGLAVLPMGLPILPIDRYITYQAAIGIGPPRMERGHAGVLPQHYADMFGWEPLAVDVACVWHGLSEAERRTAGIVAQSYGEAAALDQFGRRHSLPLATSGHNSYYLWGSHLKEGGVVIVVASEQWRPRLEALFDEVVVAAISRCDTCLASIRRRPIYVCRGWKQPLARLWPRLKRFI